MLPDGGHTNPLTPLLYPAGRSRGADAWAPACREHQLQTSLRRLYQGLPILPTKPVTDVMFKADLTSGVSHTLSGQEVGTPPQRGPAASHH